MRFLFHFVSLVSLPPQLDKVNFLALCPFPVLLLLWKYIVLYRSHFRFPNVESIIFHLSGSLHFSSSLSTITKFCQSIMRDNRGWHFSFVDTVLFLFLSRNPVADDTQKVMRHSLTHSLLQCRTCRTYPLLFSSPHSCHFIAPSCTWQSRDTIDNIFIYPMVIVVVVSMNLSCFLYILYQ